MFWNVWCGSMFILFQYVAVSGGKWNGPIASVMTDIVHKNESLESAIQGHWTWGQSWWQAFIQKQTLS